MSAPALSETVEVDASPARVFALWSDAAGWPAWDPDLESASLDGPFAPGGRGALKPRGGPRTRIELTEAVPGRAFTAVSSLPLCRMVFEHRIEPLGAGAEACRVTHSVRFAGPLAGLFRRLVGPTIRRGLPGTMAGLKRAAERRGAPSAGRPAGHADRSESSAPGGR